VGRDNVAIDWLNSRRYFI
jgi:hypothetical protein